jgi:uncharacterized protein YeaO (DUF488 family)
MAGEEEPQGYASPACALHEVDAAYATGARIGIRRAYDPPGEDEGWRVLIDRIWPRGVTRARLAIDAWEKDLAPSTELRRWFGHDPARWQEFRARYRAELAGRPEPVQALVRRLGRGPVTLVFGAKDAAHSNAAALRELLLERFAGRI